MSVRKLVSHIKDDHKMNTKDYYDKYIKLPNEGNCAICGKPTKFLGISQGYVKTCNEGCKHIKGLQTKAKRGGQTK
jgi:hypothetical protein